MIDYTTYDTLSPDHVTMGMDAPVVHDTNSQPVGERCDYEETTD